jgi:hypothetical protein
MTEPAYPTTDHDLPNDARELELLEAATSGGPRGAVIVSGVAVGLLMLCWLLIYFLVFIPRGTVG